MACILAALGMMPFKGATAPASSSTRLRVAEESGKLAVQAAAYKRTPQQLLTRESFLNAITVLQAIGGSTNAVVHLMAIVGRHPDIAGSITLDTFDEIGRRTPLLVDLKPSGENYMTDFHNSGGAREALVNADGREVHGEAPAQLHPTFHSFDELRYVCVAWVEAGIRIHNANDGSRQSIIAISESLDECLSQEQGEMGVAVGCQALT